MHRRILAAPLSVAAVTIALTAAPSATAVDGECSVILPVTDRLENGLDLVSPTGTPTYVALQIRRDLAPLYGLISSAAVDLRLQSGMVASQIDASDPYRPASPQRLATELVEAREQLATSRAYCAP